MDALLLSRIQFAANIAFHILFPTINIALCWFLVTSACATAQPTARQRRRMEERTTCGPRFSRSPSRSVWSRVSP